VPAKGKAHELIYDQAFETGVQMRNIILAAEVDMGDITLIGFFMLLLKKLSWKKVA